MPRRADVVVFDLDDTLYHEHDYVRSGFQAVGDYVEKQLGQQAFFDVIWTLFQQGVRKDTFDRAFAGLGINPPTGFVARLVQVYREHTPQIELCPDAVVVLRQLKGHVPTALITDGPRASQEAKIHALGLRSHIDYCVVTSALGPDAGKPSPRPFQAVVEHFGVLGARCVYLGDNPSKDFIGARRLGWQTIRIRRPLGERTGWEPEPGYGADFEWTDLTPLLDWLGE